MRHRIKTMTMALVLAATAAGKAAPVVDQSFTEPDDMVAAINEFFPRIAQTFTAGIDGTLTSINLGVGSYCPFPFHLAIYDAHEGLPGSTLIGEVTLPPGPVTIDTLIVFPQLIPIISGRQYAIVVDYAGARPGDCIGVWLGAFDEGIDYYTGGLPSVFDGQSWQPFEGDLHFRTLVEPLPIEQLVPCAGPRTGGKWRSHGQYVTAVVAAVRHYGALHLITRHEARSLVTAAARSECGKR